MQLIARIIVIKKSRIHKRICIHMSMCLKQNGGSVFFLIANTLAVYSYCIFPCTFTHQFHMAHSFRKKKILRKTWRKTNYNIIYTVFLSNIEQYSLNRWHLSEDCILWLHIPSNGTLNQPAPRILFPFFSLFSSISITK